VHRPGLTTPPGGKFTSSAGPVPPVLVGMRHTTPARHTLRRAVAPLTVLALLLPVTGCGGGSPAPTSPAAFCATLKRLNSQWMASFALGLSPTAIFPASTAPSQILPGMVSAGGYVRRLDQTATAPVQADVNTITREFFGSIADYEHHGATIGQVEAYLRQHPPVPGDVAAERAMWRYATPTCHVVP
jgi:hypothetical protein